MIQTLLLAAGFSRRFGDNKLMHKMDSGKMVIEQTIEALQNAGQSITVIIRPEQTALHQWLKQKQMKVYLCPEAAQGMGHSIACGVSATANASGWIIALADMPYIQPATIEQVYRAIKQGYSISRPRYQNQVGHPVGFNRSHYDQLITLSDDKGAKDIIYKNDLFTIDVDDPGTIKDIDHVEDLLGY